MCPERPESLVREAKEPQDKRRDVSASASTPGCFPGPVPVLRHHQLFLGRVKGFLLLSKICYITAGSKDPDKGSPA